MQILFLGAPGAGKGTQCKRISKQLNVPHLSSGDLLREAVKAGTAAGVKAKSYMDQGVLVPDDVLIAMFRDKLSSEQCRSGFILDGFPRNLAQAQSLDGMLKEIRKALNVVIDIKVDDSLITERITGRRTCSNKECGAVYHLKFAPPSKKPDGSLVCSVCDQPVTTRSDDKEELVAARLKTYHELTQPLIDYYGDRALLKTVDGTGEPDAIFNEILKLLKVPA